MKRILLTRMPAVAVLAGLIVVLSAGCSSYRPAHSAEAQTVDRLSIVGTGTELGRGMTNIAFCWLEIPHEVEARVREDRPDGPVDVVGTTASAAWGTVLGTMWGAQRAVGGAGEVILSPFPPYDPLMEPAYPPYLNSRQGAPSEKPTPDEGDKPEEKARPTDDKSSAEEDNG